MKFTITNLDLKKILTLPRTIAKSASALPILQCVRFEASSDGLTCHANNLAMTVDLTMAASATLRVDQAGVAAVPVDALYQIAAKLPSGDVSVSSDGQVMRIMAGRYKANLQLNDAKLFPDPPTVDASAATIEASVFYDAVTCALGACEKDDQTWKGAVQIQIKDGRMRMASTNGMRLTRWIEHDGITGDLDCVVPRGALEQVSKTISSAANRPAQVVVSACRPVGVAFDIPGMRITARTVDTIYPDLDRIIPTAKPTVATFNRKDAMQLADMAIAIAQKTDVPILSLQIDQDVITASARSKTDCGNFSAELSCALNGVPARVNLNAKYLLEALDSLDCIAVDLCATGAEQPVLIGMPNDTRATLLIAQVRVTE